jgi:two-component system C4-dicarboxylate transport sensor histidine kinase DctB
VFRRLLPGRHNPLNPRRATVDNPTVALTPDNTPAPRLAPAASTPVIRPAREVQPPRDPQSVAQLAHELANLLDGSLRNVGLVIRVLQDPGLDDLAAARQQADRLLTAQLAMRQMVNHVQELMRHRPAVTSRTPPPTLGAMLSQVIRLLSPLADSRRVELRAHIDPDVAALPAGPLGSILTNALVNSLDAIGVGRGGGIDIALTRQDDRLELVVRDDGPGLDPSLLDEQGRFRFGQTTKLTGHGLGLQHARQLAMELGGELELSPHPQGGAQLVARIPLASLKSLHNL